VTISSGQFGQAVTGPGDGALSAGAGALHRGELSTARYLLILLLVGAISAFIVGLSALVGQYPTGLMVVGLLFIGLTLWRIEVGLFVMAGLVPWELQTILWSDFSLIKAAGIVVAVLGILPLFTTRGPRWPVSMKCVLAFGLWATLSQFYNISSPVGPILLHFAALLSNMVFFYLLLRFCSTPSALRTLVWIVVLSSFSAAIAGLFEVAGTGVGMLESGRLTTGANINTYVRFLLPGVFLAPACMTLTRNALVRSVLLAGLGAGIAALILTGSRGAVAGAAAGGVLFIVSFRGISIGTRIASLLALGLAVGTGYVLALSLGAGEQWQKRAEEGSMTVATDIRLQRWAMAGSMILDHPVLGLGTTIQEGREYARRGLYFTESHNDIISAMAQTGIPGGLCYIVLVVAVWRDLWRLPGGLLRASLLGMWTAFLITAMFNPSLTKKIFWLAAGVCAASIVSYRQVGPESGPETAAPTTVPSPS